MRKIYAPQRFASYPRDWHMSPTIDVGHLVFFSGITAFNADHGISPDPETQFRDAFAILGESLVAADLEFADIVDLTTYHVELQRHIQTFVKVKDEFVTEPYPTWTAIGITELWTPGTLVEIKVIAIR